jgi:pimeloyl-ACP methyl ester carboxylesterase
MGSQRNAKVRKLARRSRTIRRGRSMLAAGKRPFRRGVGRALENPALPYVADMSGSSRTLLVAFGGMQGELGMPVFEFFKSTRDIPVKRLFVRDVRQSWYHGGLSGDDATLTDATESLRELIAREDVDRLVTVGNSAGGYAALVFGTLLGAETVLSFSPQTVLDLDAWRAMKDGRWEKQLRPLAEVDALDPRWTDLRSALPQARSALTRYEIFFDETHRLDRLHAERLTGIDGVRLYRFGRGGHMVSLSLRRSGGLDRLLRRALGQTPAGLAVPAQI